MDADAIAAEVFEGLRRKDLCWISALGSRRWFDLAADAGKLEGVNVEDLEVVCGALDSLVDEQIDDTIYAVLRTFAPDEMLARGNTIKSVEEILVELQEAAGEGTVDQRQYGFDEHGDIVHLHDGTPQGQPTYRLVSDQTGEEDDEKEIPLVCPNCGWEGDEEDATVGEDALECPDCGEDLAREEDSE